MQRPTHREIVERFRETLVSHGLLEAMRFVNARSSHRFTAIYYFDGPMLRNLFLVDREDPAVRACPDVPVEETYCVYVRETGAPFQMDASLADPRVEGHPKQQSVQSYCGFPILAGDGTLWGSICHFDYAPRHPDEAEIAVLEAITPMVMRAIEDGAADAVRAPLDAPA